MRVHLCLRYRSMQIDAMEFNGGTAASVATGTVATTGLIVGCIIWSSQTASLVLDTAKSTDIMVGRVSKSSSLVALAHAVTK
jgi:hypothetical protein